MEGENIPFAAITASAAPPTTDMSVLNVQGYYVAEELSDILRRVPTAAR